MQSKYTINTKNRQMTQQPKIQGWKRCCVASVALSRMRTKLNNYCW